jgi:hypothetical protein
MRKVFTAHQVRTGKTAQRVLPAPAAEAGRPSAQPLPDKDGPNKDGPNKAKETGGPSGPEPTRYGDWERKGICVDF